MTDWDWVTDPDVLDDESPRRTIRWALRAYWASRKIGMSRRWAISAILTCRPMSERTRYEIAQAEAWKRADPSEKTEKR